MYSLDSGVTFDPFDLSADVNPEGVVSALASGKYSTALMMSFKLNERELIVKSVESVPPDDGQSSPVQIKVTCSLPQSNVMLISVCFHRNFNLNQPSVMVQCVSP